MEFSRTFERLILYEVSWRHISRVVWLRDGVNNLIFSLGRRNNIVNSNGAGVFDGYWGEFY